MGGLGGFFEVPEEFANGLPEIQRRQKLRDSDPQRPAVREPVGVPARHRPKLVKRFLGVGPASYIKTKAVDSEIPEFSRSIRFPAMVNV